MVDAHGALVADGKISFNDFSRDQMDLNYIIEYVLSF